MKDFWNETDRERFEKYYKILQNDKLLYTPEYPDEIANTGVSKLVFGPAMNIFILWVLKDALNRGVKRLYFLARDGYLMYKTAEIFCDTFEIPMECKYLYCSRFSLRVPMYHLELDKAYDFICRGGIDVTMDKILDRACLDEDSKQTVLQELNRKPEDVVPYAQLSELSARLKENKTFQEAMINNSKERFPGLQGYLEQEGLFDGVKSAVVDSGWTGSMQASLNRLMNYVSSDKIQLEGYYWGLYELPADVDRESYHPFYFNYSADIRRKVEFNNCLFEGIFSAPHGMTLSYYEENGTWKPLLDSVSQRYIEFMSDIEADVIEYTKNNCESRYHEIVSFLKSDMDQNSIVQHSIQRIQELLKIFMIYPTSQEVEQYGNLHFSDDILEDESQYMAALLTEENLKQNHFMRKLAGMAFGNNKDCKESAWFEGSAVRCGIHVESHIRSYRRYKYLRYIRKQIKNR